MFGNSARGWRAIPASAPCPGAMRVAARLSALPLMTLLILGVAAAFGATARAAGPYTVTVSAATDPVAPGATAVFHVRVEGQTANLPSFAYDVTGGTVAGVASLDPTAANVAEGAVFVSRDSAGTATLNVRLGSTVLATSSVRFASLGSLNVRVTLNAGIDAAARTWRYEVVSASGQVVATLTANTSGDAPVSTVTATGLPFGFYTVRQVLGGDTRTACDGNAFYVVQAPVSAETTVELASAETSVAFTIAPCPGIPDLEVSIPIDTIAQPGTVGDADVEPGVTPISEVRGTRQEGPGEPLPPAAGNTMTAPGSSMNTLLLLLGGLGLLAPGATLLVAAQRTRREK